MQLNVFFLCFLSHPGAITPMGAKPPMDAITRMITVYQVLDAKTSKIGQYWFQQHQNGPKWGIFLHDFSIENQLLFFSSASSVLYLSIEPNYKAIVNTFTLKRPNAHNHVDLRDRGSISMYLL